MLSVRLGILKKEMINNTNASVTKKNRMQSQGNDAAKNQRMIIFSAIKIMVTMAIDL
jgi:hypothetical protein